MFLAFFKNIGCRLNMSETEALAHFFSQAGFGVFKNGDDKNRVIVVFVNTCTVTSKAEQKCRHTIRACLKAFPNAIILVSGCYAQLEAKILEAMDPRVVAFPGLQKGFLKFFPAFLQNAIEAREVPSPENPRDFPQATELTSPENAIEAGEVPSPENPRDFPQATDLTSPENAHDLHKMPQPETLKAIVQAFLQRMQNETQTATAKLSPLKPKTDSAELVANSALKGGAGEGLNQGRQKPKYAFELSSSDFVFRSRATLKIQDGCNSACSFCRIHIARGGSVSLQADEVIRRAKEIEGSGKNEIVLTGVNVSQYRDGEIGFSRLLKLLIENTKTVRFRISSFYPEAIDAEFFEGISQERVCPYVHLSVQSGSERILRLMKRPPSVDTIYKACETLRKIKRDIFIGADIIAGFPSETEKDFQKTLELCTEIQFQHIHAFPFSSRPGTEALHIKPKVHSQTIDDRVAILNRYSQKHYEAYLAKMKGKTFFGIVEDFSDGVKILTENYLLLPLKQAQNADNLKSGDAVFVKVLDSYCTLV